MIRSAAMVSRQGGRTVWIVLLAVLGIGALALLFIYLPDFSSKEEGEAGRQAFEERKKNFERQAEELQQKQMKSWNERQARQRRLEQERDVQKGK